MADLSIKQEAVRNFIASELEAGRSCPTHREIAGHFGFASSYVAACHVKALVRKGALIAEDGKARALRLADAFQPVLRATVVEIPLFGSIPAGFSRDREQGAGESVPVAGDSMIGKHICDGDIVVFEHGPEPRPGQIVAALIDRKNTLKTFLVKNGKPFLKAENPKYPDLIPSEELVIQGVFRALIRKARE